ncbi:MAG: hypothetical protein QOJ40_835, partial [Verrucomicrobiota bacterium]
VFAIFPNHDRANFGYRYDKRIGWVPTSDDPRFGQVRIANNPARFSESGDPNRERPGIIFLGDSFVWGYGVEASERFSEKLQIKHPEWNVYNLGACGYGTDQEYLLLQQHFKGCHPRLVFLLFCSENDDEDNSSNLRGPYFKPYYRTDVKSVELHGVPVPHTEESFCSAYPLLARSCLIRLVIRVAAKLTNPAPERNEAPTKMIVHDMQKYVNARGAVFVVGLTANHPDLEGFLHECQIPYINLSTTNRLSDMLHWTPEGHSFVCSKIDQFLASGKYLTPVQTDRPVGVGLR